MPVLILTALGILLAPVPDGSRPWEAPEPPAAVSRWDTAREPLWGIEYDWPTGAPADVLAPFAPPPVPWAPGHRGVDLAAAPGGAVLAAADGVVAFAGRVVDRSLVSIDHADGIRTTYEPLIPAVREGERVERGQVIGTLEPGHCPAGCLHLGARRGEDYLDPLALIEDPVIRLYH